MSYRTKRLQALLGSLFLATAMMTGCSKSSNTGTEKSTAKSADSSTESGGSGSTSTSSASQLDTSDMFTSRDKEVGYDESESQAITLADGGSSSDSKSVTINGDTITITEEGTYILSGKLTNGQIKVNVDEKSKVQLVLNGVDITSASSAAIYAVQADKVFITMAEGSANTLSTTGAFESDGDTNVDGVIFAKCDLTLNGSGTMTVNSTNGHGIVSKDDLVATSGTYQITAANHGLTGKDSVRIADGTYTVSSGKDAIHSENTDNTTKGFVYVAGGTFDFTATTDGIDSSYIAQIDGGTFTIASATKKGIKALTAIYVNDGSINITKSYEGMQAETIEINGGTVDLVASDDGFNAVTKTLESSEDDSTETNENNFQGGGGGRMGGGGGDNPFDTDANASLTVNGGTIHVNADGDGLDSNGGLYVNGGEIYVSGPTNSRNGAIDSGNGAVITGGIVVAAGSSGMAENFTTDSTQCSMLVTFDNTENASVITLKDSSGSELITYTPEKSYNSVVISTPDIKVGETYTVTCGSTESTVEMTSTIYGESNGMGGGGGGRMGGGGFGGRDRGGSDSTQNGSEMPNGNMQPPSGTEMPDGNMQPPGGTEMPGGDPNGSETPNGSDSQGARGNFKGGKGGFGKKGGRPDNGETNTDKDNSTPSDTI